eukprot:TRINITY_DN904_c0_g1_i1.p1 TRINITY_DN904_c0_g1~~TRINITY_DN904_c0_g1_i1.p1  ORF type:complete len:228 (-),score=42.00 TRINITY_DN904_c0_g1_i1:73-756(-)
MLATRRVLLRPLIGCSRLSTTATDELQQDPTFLDRLKHAAFETITTPPTNNQLTRKETIDRILRVDHAGERGATMIYKGQLDALRGTPEEHLIKTMADQEQEHLDKFNELLPDRRVRPTMLLPLWEAAGYSLGYITGKMGKETAMLCTVAVEKVIGSHYNDQLRTLHETRFKDEKDLRSVIRKFRDDELEHHDIALENGAEKAPAATPLTAMIQIGSHAAIWVASRF